MKCLAAQYVAETRVAMWLATCNVRGVAPSTADALSELVRQWPAQAASESSAELLRRLRFVRSARRRWAHHFRLRWRATWRRLPARSELNAVSEALKVVLFFCSCWVSFLSEVGSHKRVPKEVPETGPGFLIKV